jgi:hypothetical protein
MNYSKDIIWIMIRGKIMVNNNLNINLSSTVPLNSINYKSNQHRESFPYEYVTAGWRGDGGDEGAGDGDDHDDDPDEVQCDGDDNGDNLPSPGWNFLDRFLPAEELFSLWCFLPRRGGGV